MQDIKSRVLEFLHGQVNKNSIPHIKKGMVEDFEKFVNDLLNEAQMRQMAARMERELEELNAREMPQAQAASGLVGDPQ